jgi:hypothetical protein
MFQRVNAKDLIIGEKYIMVYGNLNISEGWYYTGKLYVNEMASQLFEEVVYHANGTKRMDYTPASMMPKYRIFQYEFYYQFVSQKERIQKAMEQRALDTILKRLINDDFSW